MEPVLWIVLAIALAMAGLSFVLLLRRPTAPAADPRLDQVTATMQHLSASQAQLTGRLAQMAEQSAAAQAATSERLQAQERQIAETLRARLEALGKQVGETLERNATQAATTINDLKTRLAVIDEAQKNITQLSTQVVGLQDILANKQARGAFGEVQLQDIVTAILPPSAYAFQAALGDGRRVDCLIRLPNPPGPIAIDAKFPLESYRLLREARDEAAIVQARRTLAQDVRRHVQDIAAKYIVPGETAESALLFLPSEAVYAELHANFTNVVEESYRARVWIVSPTTLMATLNTVRAVLKDVRMREQAGVIQTEVRTLLKDVERLDDRVEKLQRHFEQAGEDVRQIRISTDKVVKRGERIDELQLADEVDAGDALPPPAPKLIPD